MNEQETNWFLSLPKEIKLDLMAGMLKDEETALAFATMKILLDAPISKGGILSDEIQKVFDNDIANRKQK